ncbi:MAG: M48 family metallopeptidase [Micavibrio sp.]|nr:M48 family metallopeptidase [Micavibrio sp.]
MALATTGFSTYVWNNQLKSAVLLAGFPFLLVLMVAGFFFLLDLLTQPAGLTSTQHALQAAADSSVHYGPYAVLAAAIWFVIAYFFHGSMMRAATGSHPITREQMPRIYNMLENLCISRGLTMPQFEIIDSPALNAFATGIDEKSYKIVLTRGIIDSLSDDELEGVIGHELTHIINRDCRLLIISVIFVGMISFFCQMLFRFIIHGGSPNYYARSNNRDRDSRGAFVMMLVALLILAVGYVFAIAIRFALSRRREFLADAGSVELTKNPEAMMRALLRISGKDTVQGMPDEVQQMCIENSHNFMGIFATHPPIEARIDAISRTTGAPVPTPGVSLRRAPSKPWGDGRPPPAPPPGLDSGGGPWGQRL